jgi:hypothetical protein
MANQTPNEWPGRAIWIIPWLLTLGVLSLPLWLSPEPILFRDFDINDVSRIVTTMLLISLFLERALEVLISTWRGPRTTELERAVDDAKQEFTQDSAKKPALDAAQKTLSAYKNNTRRLALWVSLLIGLMVSGVGVRGLQPLVVTESFAQLPANQMHVFRIMDVLLTGGLIGGGSDGIHKVLQVFLDYTDKTRSRIKTSA